MALLRILNGSLESQEIELSPDPMTIGRASACNIRIADSGVSSRHAKIWCENGQYFLMDLGSTNGTFVNEKDVDRERLSDVRKRVNVMTLGSAALAGTSYPIDRDAVGRALGFNSVSRNSVDAVGDRDFCIEFVSAASLIMVHLSRLAEDIILYATTEFGFFELSDAVATGSSLMPQKKNPDSMELVRGKAGRVFGHLTSLLATMKGLPLAYNKDMQEDKEALFDTVDTVGASVRVTTTVLRNLRVNEEKTREAATRGYMNATELADYLVRKEMPFREAHETVGRIVMHAIGRGVELNELTLDELKSISPLIEQDVFDSLSLERTLESKSQIGGTAPERVAAELEAARRRL